MSFCSLVVLLRCSTEKNKGYTCVDNLDYMVRFVCWNKHKEGSPQNLQQKLMQVLWMPVLLSARLGLRQLYNTLDKTVVSDSTLYWYLSTPLRYSVLEFWILQSTRVVHNKTLAPQVLQYWTAESVLYCTQ